jgi:hypothetical protein
MQPWLMYDNVEVANGNRTLAYIRNAGIGSLAASPAEACDCSALGSGFVSPAADPAPWYVAGQPASAAFLGCYFDNLELAPSFQRSAAQLATGGQILGRLTSKGAALQVSGALYAANEAGMAYGQAWLARVLGCAPQCGLATTCLLPSCPDLGGGYRRLVRSGVTDGPTFASIQDIPRSLARTVTFQIGSNSGYWFSDPVTLLDEALPAGSAVCALATTEEWIGDATTRITIVAGGSADVTGVAISAAHANTGDPCPSPFTPYVSLAIPTIPTGSKLVIDGMTRTIQVLQESTGIVQGGLGVLGGSQPLRWIDLATCDRQCICVEAAAVNSNTTITIEQIDREFGASVT